MEPPEEDLSREYTVLVPEIDGDGNEVAGIRTPDISVPLATYTGWNFRPEDWASEAMDDLKGSFFPLERFREARLRSQDPRPSWNERYGTRWRYLRMVAVAVDKLVQDRLLLSEDADVYVQTATWFSRPYDLRRQDRTLERWRRKQWWWGRRRTDGRRVNKSEILP